MSVSVTGEIPGINMEDLRLRGFKVHQLAEPDAKPVSLGRRDFYKMGIVHGDMTLDYGDRILDIKGTVFFFVNPQVPHSILSRSKNTTGYACLFTETFFSGREKTELLKDSPLFRTGDPPHIPLNNEQAAFITGVFQRMLDAHKGDYYHKGEMIRNCIELILHEALRIQPSKNVFPYKNAATRITHLFMDLLERQFPIERSGEPLRLRTAQDFAGSLAVHVNYLNRAIKEVTGRPTSVHIAERITAEAKALLQHTDCNIAEIAYILGFEYPSYFNNYFKRVAGTNPNSLRKQ